MKLLLSRRGYMDEKPIMVSVFALLIFSIARVSKTAAIIVILLAIITIVMCILYNTYLSTKINIKSFLKYYNNKKYIVIEEELETELDEESIRKYVTDVSIKKISIYEYMHHYKYKKDVIKGFSFLYNQPLNNKENTTRNGSSTFLVLKREKYLKRLDLVDKKSE